MKGLEIIAETSSGGVSYSKRNKQFQLSYKTMILFIPSFIKYKKMYSFFENATPNWCGRHSRLSKKYVFRINKTQTFFVFYNEEMTGFKILLTKSNLKTQLMELLNYN